MAALLEGTWSTGWHPASAELAAATAAGFDVTAPEDGDWNTEMKGDHQPAHDPVRRRPALLIGALDDGPDRPGFDGTYIVTDDHTIVETCVCEGAHAVITIHFTLIGDALTMHVLSDTDPLDIAAATGIYDTAPFIRQP